MCVCVCVCVCVLFVCWLGFYFFKFFLMGLYFGLRLVDIVTLTVKGEYFIWLLKFLKCKPMNRPSVQFKFAIHPM